MSSIKDMKILKQKCDTLYYDEGKSCISDHDYDLLENLIKNTSGLNQKIPAKPGKVNLPIPMWSLNKRREISEKESYTDCILMDKLDGVSCLLYDGKAYTRGNGKIGSDITSLFPSIFNIKNYAIRGELVVAKKNLTSKFANTRTMACSIVAKMIPSNKLDFLAYELISLNDEADEPIETQMEILKDHEIPTVYYEKRDTCTNIKLRRFLDRRYKTSKYVIDGIVVNLNMKRNAKNLVNNPSYAFAFKKDFKGVPTTVTDIIWSVGKTGVYSPVVVFDPVEISGSVIKRVSGHNLKFLIRDGVGIGSVVEVIKSGQVIPHICKVIKTSNVFNIPKDCDEDGKLLSNKDDRIELKKLLFFTKSLKIIGVGPSKARELISKSINAHDIVTKGDVVFNKQNGKINEKILQSVREKLTSCTDVELLASLSFFGNGVGFKKICKMDISSNDQVKNLIAKWKQAWKI